MKIKYRYVGLGLALLLVAAAAVVIFTGKAIETIAYLRRAAYLQEIKRDIQRVYGLREVKKGVIDFYQEKGMLPEDIRVLSRESVAYFRLMIDPVSHEPYAYRVGSEREMERLTHPQPFFEVCANFEAPSVLIKKDVTPPCPPDGMCLAYLRIETINPIDPDDKDVTFWDHAKGYNCWTFGSDGTYISGFSVEL